MSTLTMLNHLFLMILNVAGVSNMANAVEQTTPIATLPAATIVNKKEKITLEQALVVANNMVKGDVIEAEFEPSNEQANGKYEISIIAQGIAHEVNIDANTGNVLTIKQKALKTKGLAEYSAMKQANVSLTQALEQAKQTISGTVVEAEFDGDNGKSVYKVKVVQDAQLHKMVVDSLTGALITNPIKVADKAA
ncbi:PepSY domain-containing protein [Psychrobacter sp. GP33]|uniref:PepSY domain-containing protein n=1 Tax=Psychrobacter sp. GP33 TaxID=2758709 RepID=UPI0015FBDED4|nr:PepSY domain-containing protein [Psychrobacter sp. GP33]